MTQSQDAPASTLLVIAAGGAAGASLRHLVAVWVPSTPAGWPWATWLVNLLGALLMGVLMGLLAARPATAGSATALLRPFLGVGVLGGFTTMSTQAVGTVALVQSGRAGPALGYAAATAVGAVGLAAVGWWLTSRVRARASRPPRPPRRTRTGAATAAVGAAGIAAVVVVATGLAGSGVAAGWVALGAMLGAPLRYLTDRLVQSRHTSAWPWGTLTVNVLGSLLLGLLVATSGPLALLAGTGFCGTYTTWSTAAHESAGLLRRRRPWYGIGYPVASVVLCALAAGVGAVLLS